MQGIFKIPLPDYFVFAKFCIVYRVVSSNKNQLPNSGRLIHFTILYFPILV